MIGYRLVFDREKMKLGWSNSNCKLSVSVFEIFPSLGVVFHMCSPSIAVKIRLLVLITSLPSNCIEPT